MKQSNRILWSGIAVSFFAVVAVIVYFSNYSKDSADTKLISSVIHKNITDSVNQTLTGDGKIAYVEKSLPKFNKISASGLLDISVSTGKESQVKISIDENLLKHFTVSVVDDELKLTPEEHYNLSPSKPIAIQITTPNLTRIQTGGNSIINAEKINTKTLNIVMGGENRLNLSGEIQDCNVNLGGKSQIVMNLTKNKSIQINSLGGTNNLKITGTTEKFNLNSEGNFTVDANAFIAKAVKITGAGNTKVNIRATDRINLTTLGNLTLNYYGNPKIIKNSIGQADIKKLGD